MLIESFDMFFRPSVRQSFRGSRLVLAVSPLPRSGFRPYQPFRLHRQDREVCLGAHQIERSRLSGDAPL